MVKEKLFIRRYEITYLLPYNKVRQRLYLISQNVYTEIYKPLVMKRDEKKDYLKWLKKRKHKTEEQKKEMYDLSMTVKKLNRKIKELFGGDNIFTTSSPLYKSIENDGYMVLPSTQGNGIKVDLKKIPDSAEDTLEDYDFSDD